MPMPELPPRHRSDERGQMNIANSPELLAKHLAETGGKVRQTACPASTALLHSCQGGCVVGVKAG